MSGVEAGGTRSPEESLGELRTDTFQMKMSDAAPRDS